MHPRRTADVAFPKRTFALRNCGQSSSGTVCLSVSFYIACYGWAKIDGEKQTLSVATCSPGHLLRLSWPWLPQETGSILCTTVPRLDPSPWRPRPCPAGSASSCRGSRAMSLASPEASQQPSAPVQRAEGPSVFTAVFNLLNQDSANWFRLRFWWLMPGTPFLLGSSSYSVLPSPVQPGSYRAGDQLCFPPCEQVVTDKALLIPQVVGFYSCKHVN